MSGHLPSREPAAADLHLHTFFSDGTFSPEELVSRASGHNLSVIALTDHDTVEGCARAHAAALRANIEFIPGTELTAEWNKLEIHILGYYLDVENRLLLESINRFQTIRQERVREMVERLNQLNIPLRAETVFQIANCKSPGRPHVARALVQEGFCSSLDEAFDRFLKMNRPAWVPKAKVSAAEAISIIHQAGGLAVVAHPGLNRSDQVVPDLAAAGVDGLECFHSRHSPSNTEHYLKMASEYNLLVTGGSDCHGMNKGKPLIGSVRLSLDHLHRLNEAAEARRSRAAA